MPLMTCKHTPRFSLKVLFARNPQYVCRRCGVPLEMTSATRTTNRVLNSLLVAAMIFKVLKGSSQKASLLAMAMDFGVLLLFILIYFIAFFLMLQFGKFVEKEPAEEEQAGQGASSATANQAAPATLAANAALEKPADSANEAKPQYTQEQLDLMALYKSYAQEEDQDKASAGTPEAAPGQINTDSQAAPVLQAQIHDQDCVHEPVKSWKNYIPTNFNFVCAKCGQPITLTAQGKKSINIAIMAVIFVILMPSFMNNNINSLEYAGLTLLAFLVATLIQFIYLRKARFEIRTITPKTSRKR